MKTNIELPSGVKLSISARFVGNDIPKWEDNNNLHPHYKVTISVPELQTRFDYWGSAIDYDNDKTELTKSDLIDCAICFINDAYSYKCNSDFVDFCKEFGWVYLADYNEAHRAYLSCKRSHQSAVRLFGRQYYRLQDELEQYLEQL